jgi:hypothetical protein
MDGVFFCSRCGVDGLHAQHGRATCMRCGNAFHVPAAKRPSRARAYDIWTIVLLYACMPIGMMMLWIHPTWPLRRKVLLTSLAVCLIGVPLILGLLVVASPAVLHHLGASP